MKNENTSNATETATIRRYNCIDGWHFVTLPVYHHVPRTAVPVSAAVTYQRARAATAMAHNAWEHAVKVGIGQAAAKTSLDAAVAAESAAYQARWG
jgi:hypothetical protein